MGTQHGGAMRRLVAVGAAGALVAGAFSLAAVPAYAADGNLRGIVVDPNGNPVEGFVTVYDAGGIAVANANVDAGRLAATIPTTGDFRVKFDPYDSRLQDEFYLDKADLATANPITSGAGVIQMAPWTIDYLPHVTGLVTDTAGVPIADAYIQLTTPGDEDSVVEYEYTDDDGMFWATLGSPAPVKVKISASDYATEWFNDQPTFAAADVVTPTSAGTTVGAIVLSPGAAISGTVTSDFGVPLELVEIKATNLDTDISEYDKTDLKGAYTVAGLPPGNYRIQAVDDLDEYQSEWFNNTQIMAAATPVVVAKDQSVAGIDIALAPEALTPKTGVDISGTVTNEAGRPLAGVRVEATTTPADPDDTLWVQSVYTNRQGLYELDKVDGVVDDAVKVWANGTPAREKDSFGVMGAWFGNVRASDAATPIPTSALPRTGADIRLITEGGISGTISSDTGARLRSARATILDEDGNKVTNLYSKVNGSYKSRTLAPGTYTVYFTADDHVGEHWNNTVRSKATPVVVTSGQMVSGINAVLTKSLLAVDRPTIVGVPLVGSTLTAAKGTWNMMANASYSYEWLADGAVVGTGPTLLLTSAHFAKTIAVRVSSQAQDEKSVFNGVAVSDSTSAVQATTATKAKLKIKKGKKAKKSKIKLTVSAYGMPSSLIKGKVTIKLAKTKKKLVKISRVRIKNGKATIKVSKLLKSKKLRKQLRKMGAKKTRRAKLVLIFEGSNFIESQTTVKVKKLKKKGGKK